MALRNIRKKDMKNIVSKKSGLASNKCFEKNDIANINRRKIYWKHCSKIENNRAFLSKNH